MLRLRNYEISQKSFRRFCYLSHYFLYFEIHNILYQYILIWPKLFNFQFFINWNLVNFENTLFYTNYNSHLLELIKIIIRISRFHCFFKSCSSKSNDFSEKSDFKTTLYHHPYLFFLRTRETIRIIDFFN